MTEETQNPSPRKNPDLIGQGAAERVLADAWTSGRLPHAWLMTGPRGIGKATLAHRFARYVLSEGGQGTSLFDGEPDGPRARSGESGLPTHGLRQPSGPHDH